MNKNLMLVYPKSFYKDNHISLALLYLSGASRKICDNILLYDFNIPNKETIENFTKDIKTNQPSVIGINCLFSGLFTSVMEIATHIRKLDSSIKIVIGGSHPTMYANDIIENCDCFDAVVIGEGEKSFVKLLQYWYGEADENELEGLVLRDKEGAHKTFPVINYIENLDKIPRPGYEFLNMEDYKIDTS